MIFDAEAELADMQSIKLPELKLMKFCQWLKGTMLYVKITEVETRGWEKAKLFIQKNTAATSLKADLEQKSEGSEHLDNSISGDGNKSHGQSPGQRRRHNNE